MIRVTSIEAERDIADILERVSTKGERFEVARGDEVIARIEPPEHKRFTVGDLREWLRTAPRLDPEDAEQWERELAEIRASAKLPPSPWD